jgi:DNA-binding LytR/AlgR family response regulator
MMHIAFCDDNLDELSNIVHLLNEYRASRNFSCEYAVFPNGFELLAALERGRRFDIFCLDIIMPGFSGIEVAKAIREFDKAAPIIFFTSSPEFALESYSVRAVNYILKPITREKLFITFDELLERIPVKEEEDALIVKSSEGIRRILIPNLVYAEVMGRNVLYHLISGKVVVCTEPFSAACESLMKFGCFVRPHRSYIVNMRHIDTIENGRIAMQEGSVVPIAQGKGKDVRQQYLGYQMEGQ